MTCDIHFGVKDDKDDKRRQKDDNDFGYFS